MDQMNPSTQPANALNDRDLLIRLDTLVTMQAGQMKEMSEDIKTSNAVNQKKFDGYDTMIAAYPADKLTSMLMSHEKWITEFKITWKVILVQTVGISSLVTFAGTLAMLLLNIIHLGGR